MYQTEDNNYNFNLRLAEVVQIVDESSVSSLSDSSSGYGTVRIQWLDGSGTLNKSIKVCYYGINQISGAGLYYVPSIGDIVGCLNRPKGFPIIVAYYGNLLSGNLSSWNQRSNDSLLCPIHPLVAGEWLWRSGKQAEIYLDRHGSINLSTYNRYSVSTIYSQGNAGIARPNVFGNKQGEFVLGPHYSRFAQNKTRLSDGDFSEDTVAMRGDKEILSTHVLYNSGAVSETISSYTRSSDRDTFQQIPISSIITVKSETTNTVYREGTDYIAFKNGVLWKTGGKRPAAGEKVIFDYYKQLPIFSSTVDDDGNLNTSATAINLENSSNQSSLIIGKDGQVDVLAEYIHRAISQQITDIVNTQVVNCITKLLMQTVDVAATTFTLTYVSGTDAYTLTPENMVSITSVTGFINAGEAYTFKQGVDFRLDVETNSIIFLSVKPDNASTVTIAGTYTTPRSLVQLDKTGGLSVVIDPTLNINTSAKDITQVASGTNTIEGQSVLLGSSSASQAVVLGNLLLNYIISVMNVYSRTHVHPIPGLPNTGAPLFGETLLPDPINILSSKIKVE